MGLGCEECGAELDENRDVCAHQTARVRSIANAGPLALARRLVILEDRVRALSAIPQTVVPQTEPRRRKQRTPRGQDVG